MTNLYKGLLTGVFTILLISAHAQNVGINDTGADPDPSAILDLSADGKGLLVPRTDTLTVNSNGVPATGLLIFESLENEFYYYTGRMWTPLQNRSTNQSLTYNSTTGDLEISDGNTVTILSVDEQLLDFDSSTAELRIDNGNIVKIKTIADTNSDTYITVDETVGENHVRFGTNGAEAMVIDEQQQVGVGVTPEERFEVMMGTGANSPLLMIDQQLASMAETTNDSYQSFLATESGQMISFEYIATLSTNAGVYIYEGEGILGNLLFSGATAYPEVSSSAPFGDWYEIPVSGVELTAGQYYTIAMRWGNRWVRGQSDVMLGNSGNIGISETVVNPIDFPLKVHVLAPGLPGRFSVKDDGVTINEYTLPSTDGSTGQVLSTDGSGGVSWTDVSTSSNTDNQTLDYDPYSGDLRIDGGNTVTISTDDADADPTNELELPQNPAVGDMTFWNGTGWTLIPGSTVEGATLQIVNGVPSWTATTTNTGGLQIGDYEKGGIVFWLDGLGGGLVVAMEPQEFEHAWQQSPMSTNAIGTAIGSGAENTEKIVSVSSSSTAAKLCYDLESNGYSDWFLPSRDELNELYLNSAVVNELLVSNGGVPLDTFIYWSSTEASSTEAMAQSFEHGGIGIRNKASERAVRAIRAF